MQRRQRAKEISLREGDKNLTLFHTMASVKKRSLMISFIKVGDTMVEEGNDLNASLINYFEVLFMEEEQWRPTVCAGSFRQISYEDTQKIISPFSEEETRNAVFKMEACK